MREEGRVRVARLARDGAAVSFTDEERAELIAALSLTAGHGGDSAQAAGFAAGRTRQWPSAHGCRSRADREHAAIWRAQLDKLHSRLTGVTIEPPTRVQ